MGNVSLCVPSMASNSVVKVVSSDGKLMIFSHGPIKAADIMLQNPGKFLCESMHLRIGQRITGLCAEEELENGHLYFLLPMEMLYSVLTNEEMKWLTHTSSSKPFVKQLHFSKIFPEFCLFPNTNNSSSSSEACKSMGNNSYEVRQCQRFSRQRSWEPALETIVETPFHT